MLHLAATVREPTSDLTLVFYDNEEVAAKLNGLRRVAEHHPEWLAGDLAILLEPTDALIEGGCQGTLRCRGHRHRTPRPQCPLVARRQRHPRGWPAAHQAGGLRTAVRRHRRLRVPRRPVRSEDQRRHCRQRRPRRMHRHHQLPVCPRPQRSRGARSCRRSACAVLVDAD